MDIENLDFEVIANDAQFIGKVESVEKRAKQFNRTVSDYLELKFKLDKTGLAAAFDKVRDEARDAAKDIKKAMDFKLSTKQIISSKGVQNAQAMIPLLREIATEVKNIPPAPMIVDPAKLDALISKLDRFVGTTKSGVDGVNASMTQSKGILSDLVGMVSQYFSARGITQFLSSMVRITGELEMQQTALKNIIQDVEGADKVFGQLKELAVTSPYTLQELTSYTKQLAAFSFPKEELFETNKMLADVAAGLGVSMDRIILAYGQVRSASFLRGMEVRQFTEAGIPILEMLAKQFQETEGRLVSAAEVFNKISARQVPFEMVEKAFRDMTSEGGKFYNMQEVLSRTLQGRIMKLKDSWQIALSDMGNSVNGTLKGAVDLAISLVNNLDKVLYVAAPIASAFGSYSIFAKDIPNLSKHFKAISKSIAEAGSVSKWLATTWSGRGVIAGGVALIGVALIEAYNAATKFRREIEAIKKEKVENMNENLRVLENIKARLDETKEGTQNYKEAIHDLNSKLGEFLPELAKEADGLDKVKDAANGAADAIRAKAAASAEDVIRQKVIDKYRDRISNEESNLANSLQSQFKQLTKNDAYSIISMFRGALESSNGEKSAVQILDEVVSNYIGKNVHSWAGEYALGLGTLIQKFNEDLGKQLGDINDRFGTHYDTKQIADTAASIESAYTVAIKRAKEYTNEEEREAAVQDAKVQRLKKLIMLYEKYNNESKAGEYRRELRELTAVPEGWQKLVDDALKKLGARGKGRGDSGLWAEAEENYWDYIDSLQKGYKEVSGRLHNLGKQENTAIGKQVKEEIKARKAVAAALGINLYEKGTSETSEDKAAKKSIQTQIDSVRELQRAYKDLIKDGFSEEEANGLLDIYFSYMDAAVRSRRDFSQELMGLADQLEQYDEDAAKRLRADVAREQAQDKGDAKKKELKDQARAAKEAEKALNKYLESLQKWMDATGELSGAKTAFKVSKAISDYKKALSQANTKLTENATLAEKAYGKESPKFQGEVGKLMDLWTRDRANALATLRNNVESLADDLLKEQLEGFDLTNWNDKTLGQINDIANAIQDVEVPDDIKEMLKEFPDLLRALEAALSQLAGKKLNNTINPEKFKKIAKYASEAATYVKEFAGSLNELAVITNNNTLADMSNGLSDVAEMASKATNAYSEFSDAWSRSGGGTDSASGIGSIFGSGAAAGAAAAWIAVIVALNVKAIKMAAEEEKKERQIMNGLRGIHNTIREKDNVVETMFGASGMEEINQAANKVNQIREDIDKYRDSINSFQFTTKHYGFWEKAFGWMYSENWSNGELLPDLKKTLADVEGVYDKYGNLDADVLRGILETYPDISEEERDWINRAIEDSEAYAKAVKEVAGLLSDIYGNIAADASDAIIDTWVQAGNAALDYADILDDVARRYSKMLIQDAILKDVLTEERADEIANKFIKGDVDSAMGMIAADMERIADMAPEFTQILQSFDPYFKRDDSANSTGEGFKSITEETASLLASYINAMRADLSYIRGLQEKGWNTVSTIGTVMPSLNDYLAKIAASNYEIQKSNQSILDELRSVIGSEGSTGSIVRVQLG